MKAYSILIRPLLLHSGHSVKKKTSGVSFPGMQYSRHFVHPGGAVLRWEEKHTVCVYGR